MARLMRVGALLVVGAGAVRVDDDLASNEDVNPLQPCEEPDHMVYEEKMLAAKDAAGKATDTAKFETTLAQESSASSARAFERLADAKAKVADENCQNKIEKESLKSRSQELCDARTQANNDAAEVMLAEQKALKAKRAAQGASMAMQMTETLAEEGLKKSSEEAAMASDAAGVSLDEANRQEKKTQTALMKAQAEQAEKAKEADAANMKAEASTEMMVKCRHEAKFDTDKIRKDLACTQQRLQKVVKDNQEAEQKANKDASNYVSEEAQARNDAVAVVEQHASELLKNADKLKMDAEKQQRSAMEARMKADEMAAKAKSTCKKLAHQAEAEKAALLREEEDKKEAKEDAAKSDLEMANDKVAVAARKLALQEKEVATDLAAKEKVEKNIDAVMCKAKKAAEAKNKDAQKTIEDCLDAANKKKDATAKELEDAKKAAQAAQAKVR